MSVKLLVIVIIEKFTTFESQPLYDRDRFICPC